MKRILIISVIIALLSPVLFWSCKDEDEPAIDTNFMNSVPSSGIYFKAKIGSNITWEGSNITEMYAKTEPLEDTNKFVDIVVCTEDQTSAPTVIGQWCYAHVSINDDGSFSNYAIKYAKNKTTGYPFSFEEYMNNRPGSGNLQIIEKTAETITAKFKGKLYRVNDNSEVDVIMYFQEFPLSPAKK
jgi:hypothetical protein